MIRAGMTRLQAAEEWVNGFNAVPTGMIAKLMTADPDDWREVTSPVVGCRVEYEDVLPMWDTMWSFGDSCDRYWLDDDESIDKMSQCGFRIFKSEEFGYFFGIDGAGYNFYESHWLPLYKERGLEWHDPETDNEVTKS